MARRTTVGDTAGGMARHRRQARGFTYILLLWWVAISGVLLAALGQQWLIESRRQREAELVFRGQQIGLALAAYRAATPVGQAPAPLRLDELLEDRRGPEMLRHLRLPWPDPITGQPWVIDRVNGRIVGVHSPSKARPIKPPEGVDTYEQWRFDAAALPSVMSAFEDRQQTVTPGP